MPQSVWEAAHVLYRVLVAEELQRAAERSQSDAAAQLLIDGSAIRNRLLQFGWVKDARVSRRLPDSLVIDLVERTPSAVWQHQGRLNLIDGEGVVLDAVPVDKLPELPLLVGPGANRQAVALRRILDEVPTLEPQLASATWIGDRRWDLSFATGETVSLPETTAAARTTVGTFSRWLAGRNSRQPATVILNQIDHRDTGQSRWF